MMTSGLKANVERMLAAALACAGILAVGGCGGGGDAAMEPVAPPPVTATPPPALPSRVDYTAAARPLNVTPTFDASAPASTDADVPLTGATLAVTGADGTRYTLTIPDNALRSPVRIHMQAVASVAGLPSGIAAVYGVQFEPSGLQFMHATTLTIEPTTAVPLAQQALLAWSNDGDDAHLVAGASKTTMQIDVLHFSGYAAAMLAREQSVTAVFRDVIPRDAEARLQAAVTQALIQHNNGTLGDDEFAALLSAYFDQYEKEVIAPIRAAAGSTCANGLTAIRYDLSLQRTQQLIGLPEGNHGAFVDDFKVARKVCFQEADQRCRVSGNVEELVFTHLGMERNAQLLGVDDADSTTAEESAIDKCGRYEVQFDSTVTYDGNGVPNALGFGRLSVTSRVPIALPAPLADALEGNAEITYTETTTRANCGDGCGYSLVVATRPDTARVIRAVPKFKPLQGPDIWSLGKPVEQTGTLEMEFDPGHPGEDVDSIINTPMGPFDGTKAAMRPPSQLNLWSTDYFLVNQSELGSSGYIWKDDWTQGTYPVMYERSSAPSSDDVLGHYVAITKVRLVHKPI